MPLRIAGWVLRTGKAGVVTLLVAGLLSSHWWAYKQGQYAERDQAAEALSEYRQRVITAEARLRESQRERQDAQREALKGIRDAEDPTGCADQPVPADILNRL